MAKQLHDYEVGDVVKFKGVEGGFLIIEMQKSDLSDIFVSFLHNDKEYYDTNYDQENLQNCGYNLVGENNEFEELLLEGDHRIVSVNKEICII